jgi:hypothetical protein
MASRAHKADPPMIAGTVAGQSTTVHNAISPFANVTLADLGAATITVTVTPSTTANGVLSDPHAASDGSRISNGVYSVSGTVAQVQAALEGLIFAPSSLQTPGSAARTSFTIGLDDGNGGTASDATTSVVVVAPTDPSQTDAVIQNETTGVVDYLKYKGSTLVASNTINYGLGSAWKIVADGNFSGNEDLGLKARSPANSISST